MQLDDWVTFTGRVTDDKVLRQYIAAADLCIAPDPLTEYGDLSTTNKMIEYLALGRPTVAYDLTEHRRTAQDAAVYVEPNDDVKLGVATRELLVDEERRLRMGRLGQERFRGCLAWENSEKALTAMYSRLFGSGSAETELLAASPAAPAVSRSA
jgi:glycosyltransferase involved in cell wall biosynthesis